MVTVPTFASKPVPFSPAFRPSFPAVILKLPPSTVRAVTDAIPSSRALSTKSPPLTVISPSAEMPFPSEELSVKLPPLMVIPAEDFRA